MWPSTKHILLLYIIIYNYRFFIKFSDFFFGTEKSKKLVLIEGFGASNPRGIVNLAALIILHRLKSNLVNSELRKTYFSAQKSCFRRNKSGCLVQNGGTKTLILKKTRKIIILRRIHLIFRIPWQKSVSKIWFSQHFINSRKFSFSERDF